MKGEFLSLDTAKKLQHQRNEKKIDKNMLEANIRLVDENKWLKNDNEILNRRINKAIKYIEDKSIEYKPHYRKVDLNTKDCCELLTILDGTDVSQ